VFFHSILRSIHVRNLDPDIKKQVYQVVQRQEGLTSEPHVDAMMLGVGSAANRHHTNKIYFYAFVTVFFFSPDATHGHVY
jgi:hypothetical protein